MLDIHPDHYLGADTTQAADLANSSDAGLHNVTSVVPVLEVFEFIRNRRPRTDDAHFAPQYVEELRQLVEAGSPQPPPHARHARIVCQFVWGIGVVREEFLRPSPPDRLAMDVLVGVVAERPEFEAVEQLLVSPDPALAK